MLADRSEEGYHEPVSVAIVRLVCLTTVALVVLLGAGLLLVLRPEYSSAAIALIGVIVGACFGLVGYGGLQRRRRGKDSA
jgi:hypothetical protein